MPLTAHENLPSVTEGDTATFTFSFTDSSGNALDISAWTVYLTVKRDESDPDSDAVISKDVTNHTDGPGGKTAIEFTEADTEGLTGGYHYDLQVKRGNGDIQTFMRGTVRFEGGITERTT